MTKEDWNTLYYTVMPILGVGVSAFGVAIGLLALERSKVQTAGVGSLGRPGHVPLGVNTPRVHYDNGLVLVEVRNPGEWHELREFIQPANPDVVRIVRSLYG